MHHVTTEALHQAIQKGDESLVRNMVNKGADMDEVLGLRGTALCAAISAKQPSIAEFLIVSGCDVNAEDYDREPPLLLALRKKLLVIAKQIIDLPRCNLNKIDPLTKFPPLCFAAMIGLKDASEWLIKAGSNLKQRDADGNSPLHLAVTHKHYNIIKQLVSDTSLLLLFNDQGCTPVHIAAQAGDISALQTIFLRWIHVEPSWENNFEKYRIQKEDEEQLLVILNFKTKLRNETALILAIREGFSSAIKLLLKFGVDPNLGGKSDISPILLACTLFLEKKIDIEAIEWLLLAGANLSSARLVSGKLEIPLIYAAKHNSIELVKTLIKYGANVNYTNITTTSSMSPLYASLLHQSLDVSWYFLRDCKEQLDLAQIDDFGRNYLHVLAGVKKPEVSDIVTILVQKGCKINGPEAQKDGETPLHLAVGESNIILIKALVKYGASVNMCLTGNGYSPLHICADEGNVEIARILLESGADINLKDKLGNNPLEVVLDYVGEEHIVLSKFLLQAGSDVPSGLDLDYLDKLENSGSDDDSDTSFSSDDIPAAINEDGELKKYIFERLRVPRSLQDCSLNTVRKHFINHKISFSNIFKLTLPTYFVDKLLYKHL